MSKFYPPRYAGGVDHSRRRFVTGLAAGSAAASLGIPFSALLAQTGANGAPVLSGDRFDLSIGSTPVNLTGRDRIATTVNGSLPAPTLRWREGDEVVLRVRNTLAEPSSIHWHGIILPTEMDGVPGLSFDGIAPGESYTYRFRLKQSGTYWYHSHSGFQEQTGLYGALVVEPRGGDRHGADRDHVVMLSDWTDEDPNDVYAKLKKLSHYYNFNERTVGDLFREVQEKGVEQTWNDRAMWNRMRMTDRDLSDVTGYTYTFLMNGRTPAEGWQGLFRRGERVKLRFINSSAMTFFDVRIPGLKMTVVAADGQDIEPVTIDEFRIGVAETYDVIVEPKDDRAYSVFAQALDRSGYARGTLTPDPALEAPVPELDPLPILTHTDMGMAMDHGAHAMHGEMGQMQSQPAAAMDHGAPAMDHGKMAMDKGGMNMDAGGMSGHTMDHGAMAHSTMSSPAMDHGAMAMSADSSRPRRAPDMPTQRAVSHAKSEYGPHVDMRADAPRYRLDDPGVGLRDNGRRVLTYADLRNVAATPDPRDPGREIELHLTGNMSRYMWSINGVKYADAAPLALRYGERVRITLVNDTMMNHPIHLHGMWSDLETGDNAFIPRKHTVVVQPGAMISYRVTADARGRWAYHCHLLYHMLGMFREVHVA